MTSVSIVKTGEKEAECEMQCQPPTAMHKFYFLISSESVSKTNCKMFNLLYKIVRAIKFN